MDMQLNQFIEFGSGKEKYAIPIADIHEIIRMQDITEIPNVKSYVKGVINLRGHIVPVISLRNLFGFESDEYSKATRIIVVNHEEETVGIIVDQVYKVATYTDIQPPPERVSGIGGANFEGIGMDEQGNEGIVGILKLDRVLIKEEQGHEQQ